MHIVLDTAVVPSIIYIWYEGGELRPPLVKLDRSIELALANHRVTRKVPRSVERRHRVSVPGGSHE